MGVRGRYVASVLIIRGMNSRGGPGERGPSHILSQKEGFVAEATIASSLFPGTGTGEHLRGAKNWPNRRALGGQFYLPRPEGPYHLEGHRQ